MSSVPSGIGHTVPGRVWSLWDMMNLFAVTELVDYIRQLQCEIDVWGSRHNAGYGGDQLTGPEQERVANLARMLSLSMDRQGLSSARDVCSHAHNMLLMSHLDVSSCKAHLTTLIHNLRSELVQYRFVTVQKDRGEYVNGYSFGEGIDDKLPKATPDTKEAGNCIAVGLYIRLPSFT